MGSGSCLVGQAHRRPGSRLGRRLVGQARSLEIAIISWVDRVKGAIKFRSYTTVNLYIVALGLNMGGMPK